MKQVVQHVGSGILELADVPDPACRSGGIVVRNVASLISAGTERSTVEFASKSLLGKAQQRPDLVKRTIEKVMHDGFSATLKSVKAGLQQTVTFGYSSAGVVEEVGRDAEEFAPGDRVACAGTGYASHAETIFVPKNLAVVIPEGVSFADASYVTLGSIALQGVRIAEPQIGEWVAVIGMGLLGLLAVQLLRANGCRVIGVDLDQHKADKARDLGAELSILRSDDVLALVRRVTSGVGVDAVVVTAAAESNDPIELAAELCRQRGRISMVGAVSMNLPRQPFYMKELSLRMSRSYGPGRYDPTYEEGGQDYPIGYVRWTERRNMQEFLRLVAAGLVTPSALTTHQFAFERVTEAYDVVTGKIPGAVSGVVLNYSSRSGEALTRTMHRAVFAPAPGVIGVGFIGAGGFAKSVLLPRFAKRADVALAGIATATGLSATTAAKNFGAAYATTDIRKVLDDPAIALVVIATRHGSHSPLAADALRAGKAVFVEKPLAIDEPGLRRVVDAQQETNRPLFVGFNRRFAPLARAAREALSPGAVIAVDYRINAGRVPADSWVHDIGDGGGRIIGEVCHFVDFLQFLTNDVPREVFASGVGGSEGALHDTVHATIRFAQGSIGSVSYYATGDSSVPKERIEVFSEGKVILLDDFRALHISSRGKTTSRQLKQQDKGFDDEIDVLLRTLRDGGPLPISPEALIATTRTTFAIEESLRTGRPVVIEASP